MLLALLAACGSEPTARVTGAELDALTVNLELLLGVTVGVAWIEARLDDGTVRKTTALVGGGLTGWVVDVSGAIVQGDLEVSSFGVAPSDLFAPYDGRTWAVNVGVGMRFQDLSNARGVRLRSNAFCLGASAYSGSETLHVLPVWSSIE